MFRFGPLVALALTLTACGYPPPVMSAMAAAACSAARLDPGEAPFTNCVRSLRQLSAPAVAPITRSQEACSALGLVAGTAPYSTCVANIMATFEQGRQLGS